MIEFYDLTTYTVEGAGAIVLAVIAYKIYKLRVTTESDCCENAFRMATSSRGTGATDLELGERPPPSVPTQSAVI